MFDKLTKKLVVNDADDEYYFVEMFKISEFEDAKGFLLFFGPEYSALGKHVRCDYAQRLYQWNNGLITFSPDES